MVVLEVQIFYFGHFRKTEIFYVSDGIIGKVDVLELRELELNQLLYFVVVDLEAVHFGKFTTVTEVI